MRCYRRTRPAESGTPRTAPPPAPWPGGGRGRGTRWGGGEREPGRVEPGRLGPHQRRRLGLEAVERGLVAGDGAGDRFVEPLEPVRGVERRAGRGPAAGGGGRH